MPTASSTQVSKMIITNMMLIITFFVTFFIARRGNRTVKWFNKISLGVIMEDIQKILATTIQRV